MYSDNARAITDVIEDENDFVLALSFLIECTNKEQYLSMLMDYVLENKSLYSVETQFFLYQQLLRIYFQYNFEIGDECRIKIDMWLWNILEYFRSKVQDYDELIPVNKRQKNLIFVVTDQFLDEGHAPTKLTMQWCDELVKNGKRVLLINTAECCTLKGAIPFCGNIGSYISEYTKLSMMEVGYNSVPFFQCNQGMPDIETIESLLSVVKKERPELVISIGDIIFSDLANKMVPVYSVALGLDMPHYFTKYRMFIGKKMKKSDEQLLSRFGFTDNAVISTYFTFDLPKQVEKHLRSEFGIKDNSFCLLIVGNRLEYELSNDFMTMLNNLITDDRFCVLFVGRFDYEQAVAPYNNIVNRSIHIGYANDLLSIVELCDLYINPRRMGGGTSAIFALKKGKPVVTVNYGDVALNSGEDFCVTDYKSMEETIIKYIEDQNYYNMQSKRALEKAMQLTESDNHLYKQVLEIEKREKQNEKGHCSNI